jgi:DNA-binding Lrp family transcriptional regulator
MLRQEYLRPHDVCVALQLAIDPELAFRALSDAVGLSLGEVHNAVKRLELARLASHGSPVNRQALLEFAEYGVPYAYPAVLGPSSRGIPTAFSAEPLAGESPAADPIVWPSPRGPIRGATLSPLSTSLIDVWERNPRLYHLMTLVDGIRVGRARERRSARNHLEEALAEAARVHGG